MTAPDQMPETTVQPGWKSSRETEALLKSMPHQERIARAVALRNFIREGLLTEGYSADDRWASCVSLSAHGQRALELLKQSQLAGASEAETHLALFSKFSHAELLVDCDDSDLDTIEAIVNDELSQRRLIFPYIFGRALYDKFNDTVSSDRTSHLLSPDALALLDNTPQGIFQVGKLISGPLGLLEGQQPRSFPPFLTLRLWHCSDPGCGSPHDVTLLQVEVLQAQLRRELAERLKGQFGPASEWHRSLLRLATPVHTQRQFTYYDVAPLIGESILGSERTALAQAALEGANGSFLRAVIGAPPRKKSRASGSAEALSTSLREEEQLQLLWLLTDVELVDLIDACVAKRTIQVPTTEVRTSRLSPLSGLKTAKSELSSLGIRSAGLEPIVNAGALIWDSYTTATLLRDLDWRLRNRTAIPTRNALLDYLSQKEPDEAIRELVLSSEPITKTVCERIRCSINGSDDQTLVDRILWKMGFNLPRYSDTYSILKRRIEEFYQSVLQVGVLRTEGDRESIRSAGVNLFVSIENFLDELVAYNVWVLSSDHLLDTKFRYRIDRARDRVRDVIGEMVGNPPNQVRWNAAGENPLGALLIYLSASLEWMQSCLSAERESLVRPEHDLPFYAEDSTYIFPFRHTALWADAEYGALNQYVVGFKHIVDRINQSNLASIRNGLDHYRDDSRFPSVESMLTFVARFREAVEAADVNRYVAKLYWATQWTSDRHGRTEIVVKDYKGVRQAIFGPSFVAGIPDVTPSQPVLLAPGNLTGEANAEMIFSITHRSNYSDYWHGYPRRRPIPAQTNSGRSPSLPADEQSVEDAPVAEPAMEANPSPQTVG